MKLTTFFRPAVSLFMIAVATCIAYPCGPYAPTIPYPDFFALSGPQRTMSWYERNENLKLWQSLTSERIPLADIEEAVYHDSLDKYYEKSYSATESKNMFYVYLSNSRDNEIDEFLGIAKALEERWRETRSPWYYPENRAATDDTGDFSDIIKQCKEYRGTRLKDRYALQISRALFASRQYEACIEYSDSAFANIQDSNLMKRMAQRYVAGCWNRLGDKHRADSIFAKAGDIMSISLENPVEYMSQINPDAPQLIDYIRRRASDTLFMKNLSPIATKMLKDRRVKSKADWSFLLAYIDNEYNSNTALAKSEIYNAMQLSFSTDELKDLAHAYKMKLDAKTGSISNLLSDLKWIESKTDPVCSDAEDWTMRCRNIIYEDWVPRLWKQKDYSTAILLCAYADNLTSEHGRYEAIDYSKAWGGWHSMTIREIRDSEVYHNDLDYGCLSFQMMGSLSSEQLAAAYRKILSNNSLYAFLRQKARTDSDYYYELIGTLALREENYARAIDYLSRVSDHYIKTMNVEKEGYLSLNPFNPHKGRWISYIPGEVYTAENKAFCGVASNSGAKLRFARNMLAYKQEMLYGKTSDIKGLARLMYAIGRKNSFSECWALTQYWRGWTVIFEPSLQNWYDDSPYNDYSFLYNYDSPENYDATDNLYKKETAAALAMLKTDEARAKANYILGNLPLIMKRYGNTPTARHIRTSCDNWKSWL